MRLQSSIELFGYGTSEGVEKSWDTRGRGRKEIPTTGSRTFTLPSGRVIDVPYGKEKQDAYLAQVRQEELAKLPQRVQDGYAKGEGNDKIFAKDGVYETDRVMNVHNPEFSKYAGMATPVANPKFIAVLGGTASGKSGATYDAKTELGKNFMGLNTDEIRADLPEAGAFAGNDKHGLLHEEAGYLRDRILATGIDRGVNIVLDAPGSQHVADMLDQAERAGYTVEVKYVHRDLDSSLGSAADRKYMATELSDLRDVPMNHTIGSHNNARNALDRETRGRKFDVYDKEPDIAKSPVVFSRDRRGNVDWTRYNQDRVEAIKHGQTNRVPKIQDGVFEGVGIYAGRVLGARVSTNRLGAGKRRKQTCGKG